MINIYNTKVFGVDNDKVIIDTRGKAPYEIQVKDAIVKLWLSDGTVLGIKYCDNLLYHNIWKMRVLCGPNDKHYIHRQCFDLLNGCYSDEFETEEEVVNMRIIPRSHYMGDDV